MAKKEELLHQVSAKVAEKLDKFKGDLIDAIKQNPGTRENPNVSATPATPAAAGTGTEREGGQAKRLRKERDQILDSLQGVAAALKDGDYAEAEDIVADVLDDYEEDGEDE